MSNQKTIYCTIESNKYETKKKNFLEYLKSEYTLTFRLIIYTDYLYWKESLEMKFLEMKTTFSCMSHILLL